MTKNNAWRYYEGTTSANTVLRDIATVACTGVRSKKATGDTRSKTPDVLQAKNWDIAYPKVDRQAGELISVMDWNNLTPGEYLTKIKHQANKIGDTVILKTKTTPAAATGDVVDDLGIENDLGIESIEMYLELYKPKYLSDPESFDPECERKGVMPYLVTKDIYEEFAKGEEDVLINLKDIDSSYVINSTRRDFGTASLPSSRQALDEYKKELAKYGVILQLGADGYYDSWEYSVTIPNDVFQVLKGGTSSLSSWINTNYAPIAKDRQYEVKLYAKRVAGSGTGAGNFFRMTWERFIDGFTIKEGFTLSLEDVKMINWSSFDIRYDGDTAGQSIIGNFNVDKISGLVTCKKKVAGEIELVGEPVVVYRVASTSVSISGKKLVPNNHYIYFRLYDKLNEAGDGPLVYGESATSRASKQTLGLSAAKVSEWSKMSWYQDFAEEPIDTMDSDVGGSNMADGVVFLPIETPGLTGETRMRFWMNTNNDRFSLVIMGNPSLDFAQNKHLISNAYVGTIDSFDGGITDVAGNFALYTSSSTDPSLSRSVATNIYSDEKYIIGLGSGSTTRYVFNVPSGYHFNGSSLSNIVLSTADGTSLVLNEGEAYSITEVQNGAALEVTLFTAPVSGSTLELNCSMFKVKYKTEKGVIRDQLGNVLNVKYPDTFGKNTATGVIDIAMLHTRSKAYYQKHHMMFTTTEEYMSKDGYGKSAYTNEYFADKLKITHGNDGPRGYLTDMLAIDTSSLYAFDELIVNRDFKKDNKKQEDTFVFFPVTAPYSPFTGSPNGQYGVAMKKSYRLPGLVSDEEAVDQIFEELDLYIGDLHNLIEDVYLPDMVGNNVKITWTSSDTDAITIENPTEGK